MYGYTGKLMKQNSLCVSEKPRGFRAQDDKKEGMKGLEQTTLYTILDDLRSPSSTTIPNSRDALPSQP